MNISDQALTLNTVRHEDIARFQSAAAKEGVCLKKTKTNTTWFVAYGSKPRQPVGVCGLIEGTIGVFRLKGIYVFPEHRGQGLGASMTATLCDLAIDMGADRMEAITANPDFYLDRLGWDGKRPRGKKYWTVWKTIPVEKLVSRRKYVTIG